MTVPLSVEEELRSEIGRLQRENERQAHQLYVLRGRIIQIETVLGLNQ